MITVEAVAAFQRPESERLPARDEWSAMPAARPLAMIESNRIPRAVSAMALDSFRHDYTSLPSGEADILPGPLWAGTVEPDSTLGVRVPPQSVLTTHYLDNPRDYFELEDVRAASWDFGVEEGSAATLEFPSESKTVRIAITRAPKETPPWHIRLDKPRLPMEGESTPSSFADGQTGQELRL